MDRNDSVIFLVSLFLITNALGLVAAGNIQQYEEVQETAEQNQSPLSGLYFFVLIGIATALMLILYKYNARFMIKGWFFLALAMTTLIFFQAVLPPMIALGVTVLVLLTRVYTKDVMLMNALTVFPFAGAGAFFGSIIGFQAALALLIVLSIYDYYSVNISKHMVALAKSGIESNTFMGFTYPKEDGGIQMEDIDEEATEQPEAAEPPAEQRGGVGVLGGGDIVIPLVFAATLLPDFGYVAAVVSVIGAAVGLAFLLLKAQQGKFYPAIPPVAIGSVAGFGVVWVVMNVLLPAM